METSEHKTCKTINEIEEKMYKKQEKFLKSNMNIWSLTLFALGMIIFLCAYDLLNHLIGIAIMLVSTVCFYSFIKSYRTTGRMEKAIRKCVQKERKCYWKN
ncbi:MAG: hypothetical protein LBS69_05335 [Prevotellaceae bacterium]|jgi:hypothetical protein|nr:hypothetical protein [Prevotellaceae bacterium]